MIQGYPHFSTLEFPVPAGEPLPDLDSTRPARESRPGHPWPKCPRKTHRSTWKFSDVMEHTSVTPHKNGTSSWEKRWWKLWQLWTLKLWGSPNFLDEAKREISPAWFTDPVESSGMFLTLVSPIGQVGHEIQSNPMKSYEIILNHH